MKNKALSVLGSLKSSIDERNQKGKISYLFSALLFELFKAVWLERQIVQLFGEHRKLRE